ncbi:MAG: alpha/beta hydrolase [Methylophaga sp.]|jgi:acetyl esterase/lipase|nr:alpha/beta hydrolase [Methylophaga sp.]
MVPENGYQRIADIAYGDTVRQKLDVYLAKARDQTGPASTIIFFYGGSWESGNKNDYKFVAEALTAQGFDVVIPDYRVYPQVRFPAFVEDGASVVAWAKQHLADYGASDDRLFVAGHSAGAHIAALLTLDASYLQRVDLSPAVFNGMIGLAGPYDFLPLKSETLKSIFGPEAQRWRSQPIHYADAGKPPMLLLVGEDDLTVLPKNSYNLAAKIREKGGNVQLEAFDDYGHVAMVAKLAKPLRGEGQLLQVIKDFVSRH